MRPPPRFALRPFDRLRAVLSKAEGRQASRPRLFDWIDSRTGFRAGRSHLLDEPLPAGVGWWFVTGSILLILLAVQFVTGVILTMYYVPAPDHAYESVRFITDRLAFGRIVRGLHFFGASFIVIAAVVHMLRVVWFGSYQKPREVTWMTGVVLLLIILGFALTGYLLPWDQKAYWATTVTINIARSAPLFGESVASLIRGGADLGALTLLRWHTGHVFLLPAALVGFVLAHLYLMRRHGISGPVQPVTSSTRPFYPYQALKDTVAMAAVFAVLLTFAIAFRVPLDAVADPSDAKYVPRPEWYFLSLFQLLKYFPGPLEPVATIVIPGLIVGALLLLPFLDRGASRHPRERRIVTGSFAMVGATILLLTYLGVRDSPAHADPAHWGPLAIAGHDFAQDARCTACHRIAGAANALADTRLRKGPEWLLAHVVDPETIAPGSRRPPPGGMTPSQAQSILSYMRTLRAGGTSPPTLEGDARIATFVIGRYCANCHVIDGSGGNEGPDLTHAGAKRDAKWLHAWISDPEAVDDKAEMPSFGERLSQEELTVLANYLAARK
ncbi:MAG: cytochrome b N-terminal domain-containing protein [Vicinamibacterales bacterium]